MIEQETKVTCAICGKSFKCITNTHLWKEHRITVEEYTEKFPTTERYIPELKESYGAKSKGKTYEKILGEEKASELRQIRSEDARNQMNDPEQIEVRKDKCGYEASDEQKKHLSEVKTIHGAFTYRKRALDYYGLICSRCGFSSENEEDFHVHHEDFININVETVDHSLEKLKVLCKPCHFKLHNEAKKLSLKFYGIKSIEKGVHYIFKGLKQSLGLDLNDENFRDTPSRIARAYAEIFEGVADTDLQIQEILSSSFPCERSEMVLAKDIRVFSMCPHHLLPVDYTIHVAYVPTKKVIGLSKLARLAEILARRPILQEQFVEDVTDALMNLEGCLGAACVAEGKHYCMIMRGVCQPDVYTSTSSLKGCFIDEPAARAEFFSLVKK